MTDAAAVEEGSWLDRLRAQAPDRTAVVAGDRSLRRGELAAAAEATTRELAALGLRAGDLVAVLAPPALEGIVLIHALLEARVVLLDRDTLKVRGFIGISLIGRTETWHRQAD